MRENCTYGSVRGVLGNQHPYRDRRTGSPAPQSIPKLSTHFCGPPAHGDTLATRSRLLVSAPNRLTQSQLKPV